MSDCFMCDMNIKRKFVYFVDIYIKEEEHREYDTRIVYKHRHVTCKQGTAYRILKYPSYPLFESDEEVLNIMTGEENVRTINEGTV